MVQSEEDHAPAHDVVNCLLLRIEASSEGLWQEVHHRVNLKSGELVLDLDKQYAGGWTRKPSSEVVSLQ
jgi:hypothetical protein